MSANTSMKKRRVLGPEAGLHSAASIVTRRVRSLKTGGVTPFTATDYPGMLAAVVFVQGCPWRCGYCHNPHLQERTPHSPLPWRDVLSLLERRIGLIDAVVFSGGEPTMDPCLADALRETRELGFKTGLHSGGTHPERLESVLPLLDWVGFDVKAGFADYERITRVRDSGAPALRGLQAVLASGVAHECRTTAHPAMLPEADISRLAHLLAGMGVQDYALQVFRPQGCNDDALKASTRVDYPSAELVAELAGLFPRFTLRRG